MIKQVSLSDPTHGLREELRAEFDRLQPRINEPAAALRVAVADALAEYPADEIRAMVEFELRAQSLSDSLAHG